MSAQRAAQLVEAGLWLQMSGDIEGARRLFEQALKLDPSNARAKQLVDSMKSGGEAATGTFPLAGSSNVPSIPPALPPEPPSNPGFGMWGAATGLGEGQRSGSTPPGARPVPPGMTTRTEGPPEDPSWHALSEPMPGPSRPKSSAPIEFDEDADLNTPVPLPGVGTATPANTDAAPPKVRPVTFAKDATSAWDSQSNPGVHLDDVKPGMGDAMDMVTTPAPMTREEIERAANQQRETQRMAEEVKTLLQGARDLLDLDDHSGAMELIIKAQQLSPGDPEVQALRERSEKTLEAMYESKLGAMTQRPKVVLKEDEIIWLNLDHRAGFVLAQIDGSVTFEDLFEVCGMSRLDTARILAQLVEEGVIQPG